MSEQKNPEEADRRPNTTASLTSITNKDEDDNTSLIPRKEINWDKVETAMALGADLKMCAMFGGVHWNTLERRIVARYGENFREVRAAFMTDRKALALQKLWALVQKGDVRAVLFANRVFNGLNDKPKDLDDEDDSGSIFTLAYNLDEPPPIEAESRVVK